MKKNQKKFKKLFLKASKSAYTCIFALFLLLWNILDKQTELLPYKIAIKKEEKVSFVQKSFLLYYQNTLDILHIKKRRERYGACS